MYVVWCNLPFQASIGEIGIDPGTRRTSAIEQDAEWGYFVPPRGPSRVGQLLTKHVTKVTQELGEVRHSYNPSFLEN